jgi:hypothetical protein
MSDNKDITEFEYEIEAIINRATSISGELDIKEVINCLREIMPPVCTKTERKFLDEMKEKAEYINNMGCIIIPKLDVNSNEHTGFLFQSDFDANLSELVEGKQ